MTDDTHAADLMALVRELSDLEFRRGQLHARIEWHCRLRELADTAPVVSAPRIVKAPTAARGTLQASVLAVLAATPGLTYGQVATALGATSSETVRQALIKLLARKRVTRDGGRYAVAESHAGAGLVAVG